MPVSATVWSVSHIDGVGNKSEISDILGGIGDGDTIRIWGTEGHTYAGGIIISTPNVVIEQWEGSPVRPLITATSETPTITTTGNNILIRGLDISDNQNYPERGGGVYVDGGTLTIENTTITDNTAKYGGGVYVGGGTLTVENTTITNNDAFFDNGGGVYAYKSTLTLVNNFFCNDYNIYAEHDWEWHWNSVFNRPLLLQDNIVGGPYCGGNVWSTPGGTGFSDTHADANYDGICDAGHRIDDSGTRTVGTDAYPLVYGGSVQVNSTVTGAYVSIDGTNTTLTTNRSFYLPVGEHTISVSLTGYRNPDSQTVTITNAGLSDPVTFTLTPIVHPTVWSVSHIAGNGNYTDVSLIPDIGDGDTIQIWGTDGHTYAGGINITASNVTIQQWDGSPVRPLITATSKTSTITTNASNIIIRSLDISNNQNNPFYGGGVRVNGGTLTIEDTTITNNSVTDSGAGVWAHNGTLTIENSIITNNTAVDSGGGVSVFYEDLTIENSTITDNTASDKTGGVFAYQSTVTLVNNFLCNNGNFIAKSGPESPEFNWNVVFNRSLILEDNIVGGPYCGGNVYSTPEYTGFSDTHVDANYDGICDEGYTIYDDQNTIVGTDAYPLVYGGFVQINSSVAGATVYINGTDTALLTNRSFYLPVGVHIISVTLAGYQNPDSRTVTISNSGPNDPVLFSLSPSFVHPTVWNVSHIDGGGNYTNVSLIPEIGDGDTIRIWGADGHTYEGGFTINAANVTIKEWDRSPAAPLITNTSHSAPAISITADNVTLQALDISGNTYGGGGAGVSVEGNSTTQLYGFTIADCAFSGNSAADGGYGGAVSLRYVSNSRIMGTTFNGNSAGAGGGGVYISESEGAALTGILFENNSAGECGGGVNIVSNGATLTHTIFENNTAMYGGGAGVEESEDTVLNGVIFDNNTATFYGGGGACFINSNNGVIKNTIVTRNDADDVADGYGGGGILFCESSDADITNTTFTSNSANEKGGGLSFVLSENAGVANSTFRNNSVIANGGGVYAWGCGSAVIANTSFIDNTAGNGGGIHLNHSNSTTIKNCFLDNEDNLAVDVSINAALNYSSVSPGINIAGGPNLGGNLWITDPQENISETGTDADFNGICDESFAIAGFGTDAFPLVYGGSVQINSSVAGATVYVDGTDTGLLTNRSFYLPVGEHTVSVTLAGHPNPGSQTVPISNSETNDPITFSFSVPIVHPAIWNVSHIAGVGNYTNVSEIPEIGGGDTIRIWGTDRHTYEGGFNITAANVTIKEWEGSPVRPLITDTSHSAPAIKITADNVTLAGLNISGNTYEGHGAGVSVRGTEDAYLTGFTITDCFFTQNNGTADGSSGGAVYLYRINDSSITGTTFYNNRAEDGGGLCISDCVDATLTDTTFENNTGIYDCGGAYFSGSDDVNLIRTTFTNNSANFAAGAYFYDSENAVLDYTIVENNSAAFAGGLCFQDSLNAVVRNSAFVRNSATDGSEYMFGGGGMMFFESMGADITNTTFIGNSANGNGGGISFCDSDSGSVADSTFRNNSVLVHGGGVFALNSDSVVLANTSFIDNTAGSGGGIYLNTSGAATIRNCFLDNADNLRADDLSSAYLCYIPKISGTNIAGGPNLGGNLWITDPQQNISETATDADFDGICDEKFEITGFGTDIYPLVYGGYVQINSSVAGANVSVDGTDSGLLTNRPFYLPVGEHTISVGKAGYFTPNAQTVTITNAGPNAPVTFTLASIVHPAIWNVSHVAGVGNYTNVSCIPEIGDGDTIRIWGTDGHTYEGGFNITAADVTIKQWEGSPVRPLITDTSHSAPAIYITADNVSLQALNISGNSYTDDNSAGVSVMGTEGAHLTGFRITNCVFMANHGSKLGQSGSAFSLKYVDDSVVANSGFYYNSNQKGSGTCSYQYSNNASLIGSTFKNNTVSNHGGGVFVSYSDGINLTGTTFENNTADAYGGGAIFLYCENVVLTDTTFADNTAVTCGGGAAYGFVDNAVVTGATFTRNTAGCGGGCYFELSGNPDISNTTYTDNTATNEGGACYFSNADNAVITDTAYTGNTAATEGGACYLVSGSDDATFTDITAGSSAGDDFSVVADCTGVSFTNLTFRDDANTSVSFTFGGAMQIAGATGTFPADPAGYGNISHFVNVTAPNWMLLNVSYTDADVTGINASTLTMWNTTGDAWGEVSGINGVNTVEKYVYANLTGLGDGWNVIAPLASVAGEFQINSSPAGGWIWIDGVNRSVQTNATVAEIVSDVNHNVTVVLDDYYAGINESVNVSGGGVTDVFFELAHETGSLQVNSTPAGAIVYLNGTVRGVTNTTLSSLDTGSYNVTIERSDYTSTPKFRIVNLSAGENETVAFTLIENKYSGGIGTSDDPYQISTRTDLINLSTDSGNWDKYFILANDISLADGSPAETIGNNSVRFSGSFDGQGYHISNFTMNKAGSNYVGLFGFIDDVVIKDLRVEAGSDGVHGGSFVGVLVGRIDTIVSLTNCSVSGNVIGTHNIGGLAGYTNSGDIINCSATGNVRGGDSVGGLIGRPGDGDLIYCYATGDVISSGSSAGGLAGWIYKGTCMNCYAMGDVTTTSSSGSKIGGLVGEVGYSGVTCNLVNCYASGDVTTPSSSSKIGGLAGHLISGSSLKDCFAAGSVTGGSDYGGLVGDNEGTLENCYRYAENGNSEGIPVSDRSEFMDYDFLTETTTGNGLNWSVDIIDTAEDASKIWRVSTYKFQYPVFQWLGSGDLQIDSIPDSAAIYMNGVNTGESTNFTFTGQPAGGKYNTTVVLAGYYSEFEIITPARDETKVAVFNLTRSTGTLQINSTPDGARIYLNEVATGKSTNFTFTNKPVGEYNVTVVKDGYDTKTETVTLTNATTELVDFILVQQVGTLQINSTPSNASIYLNEVATGKSTNFTFTNKPVGEYNVTVVKDGYDTKTETVTLTNATTELVDFILVQQVGTLQINSTPSNASIYLNEVATGKSTNFTFTNKPVGEYNVTVVKDGYDTKTETVTLTNATTELVDFTLVQQVGTLQINSTPSNASIYLNEVATGKSTNFTFTNKPVGEYNVTVVKDGYDTKTETVTLTNATTERVDFTLVQQVGTLQVNSTPSNASIYLNEVSTGKSTNFTFANKPVDEYNVTVVKDGYDTKTEMVNLTNASTKLVDFTLVQQVGTLQVNSTPSNASICLNEVATGKSTNFTFEGKPVGEYNVTVVKLGYDTKTETVTLTNASTERVDFTLVQQVGTLQVNSTPSNANIYLNEVATGESTNFTFTNKPVGEYNVTVQKSGYDSASRIVTLTKDETKDVSFTLSGQVGTLQINSTPSGASVYLNGTATGDLTNATLSDRLVGTYNVTVTKDGYDSASEIVTLTKDETKDVSFTLVRHLGDICVRSSPAAATIWLDGEDTGEFTNTTLTNITTGMHTITVEKPGYLRPANRSVMVASDEVTDVFFSLSQESGAIHVASTPDKAWIWLDGCNTTVLTNTTLPDIPVGTHDIRLVKPLYYNTTPESVQVQANQTADVFFTLTPAGSKPTASFTATPVSGDSPLPVTFTDTSTGDPGLWNWSFGDGNVSAEQNPVHTYTSEGAYDVRLTVANPYGDATVTIKDCVVVSATPAVELTAPTGRISANDFAEFAVTADNLDNITELSFAITYEPAFITVEDVVPTPLVQEADFEVTIDNIQGLVTVVLSDDGGISAGSAAPVADITFRATDTIEGLRETAALTITDATARTGGRKCPVIRVDGFINVEARTVIEAPNGTLPVESSKYLTVSASGLNDVKNVSFIMEFNRTVMSVIDVRANGTMPGLTVDSTIINENGWLEVNAASPHNITGKESIPLVDIKVHSNGLPGEREIRLVNLHWARDNATYSFDDMEPGFINITPVNTALVDNQPVMVDNMTFDDDTQEVSINISANRHATITNDNTTILVCNPGIDIIIQTSGMENQSSEWTGECTGAKIDNISGSVDLSGDVGQVNTGISADISGSLSALTNADTGLNITITRGAVNETVGRIFQLGVLSEKHAELEEVAYTMAINKSALGGVTVSDAVIVMSAPERYVNTWGGAENFTILSMSDDGEVSLLETSYTYADGIFTFTALSPEGFSIKSLVAFTPNEEPLAQFAAVPVTGTAPLSVQFYDYSSGHPGSWAWDFGDGNRSNQQNPAHTYTSAGVYDVSLTITNVMGADTIEKAGYITVTNPMTVDFRASPNTGHAPLTVTFTDKTSGEPSAWLWEFGDGQTSVERNPVHTYQSVGAYTVSLTATNVYGSVTADKERFITVSYHRDSGDNDEPVLVVTPTPTPVQTTTTPTPEATVTTTPGKPVTKPAEFTGTARLPVSPNGEVGSTVILWADDHSGYLTIGAGVVARDTFGMPIDTVSIVAVPVATIPTPGQIGPLDQPAALYAYNCTPEGVTFSPAITLTFTLSEEEWNRYGNQAEVGWFNSTSGEWEVFAGVPDPGERTITIPISHFSTYALFAEAGPEVPLPDMTKTSPGSAEGSSLWLWSGLIIAIIGVGFLIIRRQKND